MKILVQLLGSLIVFLITTHFANSNGFNSYIKQDQDTKNKVYLYIEKGNSIISKVTLTCKNSEISVFLNTIQPVKNGNSIVKYSYLDGDFLPDNCNYNGDALDYYVSFS